MYRKCHWFSRNSNCFQRCWILVILQYIQSLTTSMIQEASQLFVIPYLSWQQWNSKITVCLQQHVFPGSSVPEYPFRQQYMEICWNFPEPIVELENSALLSGLVQFIELFIYNSVHIQFIDILQSLLFTLGTVFMYLYNIAISSMVGVFARFYFQSYTRRKF